MVVYGKKINKIAVEILVHLVIASDGLIISSDTKFIF